METSQPVSSKDLPPEARPLLVTDQQLAEICRTHLDVSDRAVWTVSSAKHGSGVNQLLDGDHDTFWQSDGVQPHSVSIQFRSLTCISMVAVLLDYSVDESYTPRKIIVQAATNPTDTSDVGDAEMDAPKGWVLIRCFEDLEKESPKKHPYATCVKLIVQENHQNGRDTHVRGIRVFTPKPASQYATVAFQMGDTLR